MSSPDYDQFAEDHQCLLIVIKSIGPQMDRQLFNLIYDRLAQLYEFKITDQKVSGFERVIRLRYKQSYTIENNDWGDFQAHRRLVGLITIGRSFHDNEIESISELHKTIHDTFANTLFDSRCFIIRSSEADSCTENKLAEDIEPGPTMIDVVKENEPENGSDPLLAQENQLFDFPLGEQIQFLSTTNHNSFTTHVNRSSSSSSSVSSQNSKSPNSSPVKTNDDDDDEMLLSSLPIVPSEPNAKPKTHSRNKSLDSKLLLTTEPTNCTSYLPNIANRSHSSSSTTIYNGPVPSSPNEYIQYESDEHCCEQIELRIRQFLTGLFWVLESKRLDRAGDKMEKIPLLMAPFEKKDLIGLDTDTKSFRRKCLGRMRKHIADLSLLAGLPYESLQNYVAAIEQLKAAKDKLWLAAAYEGHCVASLAVMYPNRWQSVQNLRRKYPFERGLLQNLLSRSDYAVARKEVTEELKAMSLQQPILSYPPNSSKNVLPIDQFYDRYKEAASHYALYRGASILEFECCFKAARTLICFKRNLNASEFIQNAVFISFNQSLVEQIERLLRISQLYENIGFHRKAAFYKRFAALKAVSLNVTQPEWDKCYYLLLSALYGYGVTLDPTKYDLQIECNQISWSGIHVQLLQELITTSLKMQNETLAMRHLSFALQCLYAHITPTQRGEFTTKLSSLASKCGEGSPVALNLNNGAIIPSVNFTKFPMVIYFKVEPLKPYLRPYKLKLNGIEAPDSSITVKDCGPFIYTPLNLNRTSQQQQQSPSSERKSKKVKFFWTEGSTGTITLCLHNFLSIELNISSIMLMTDGVAFEPSHDTVLKIAPNSSYSNISLTGIPRSTGVLDILGYKIHALGIKSDCHLNQLPNAKRLNLPAKFTVEIVPRLPLLSVQCVTYPVLTNYDRIEKCLVPLGETFPDVHVASEYLVSLYAGQCKPCTIKLANVSQNTDELIELVNITVVYPKNRKSSQDLLEFEWNEELLNNSLPIGRDQSISFDITCFAKGDFVQKSHLGDEKEKLDNIVADLATTSKKSQVFGSTKLANLINEFQARKSSQEIHASKPNELASEPEESVDSKFEFSGGPGLNSGFCRQTLIYFLVEIKPSVLITHWDVIPAEQPDECYLVFDTFNATEHEMNLFYTEGKQMLIEPKEKCRIPIPVKRCPLSLTNESANLEDSFNRSKTAIIKCDDFLGYIFPTARKLDAILAQCKQNLLAQIRLKWNLTNSESDGVALANEVPYSNEMLKSLLIPPIQSEVEFNGCLFRTSHFELNVKQGHHIPISVRLVNTSDATLHTLRLYLFAYQEYQNPELNRSRNLNIRSKIVISGRDTLCIDQLQTKQTYKHECGLIFLYSGVYRLEICCLPEQRYQQLNIDPQDGQQQLSSQVEHQSIFKCLHLIEVTVDDSE